MRSEPTAWVGAGLSYDLSAPGAAYDGREIGSGEGGVRVIGVRPLEQLGPQFLLLLTGHPSRRASTPGGDALPVPRRRSARAEAVFGNGRGENELAGKFTVYDVVWNAERTDVVSFAAKFEQWGVDFDGSAPPAALLGTIRYNTTIWANAGVLANDADADGDFLTTILVSGPTHGTLTLNRDGTLSYAPDADFFGTDSFTYRVTDGGLTSDVATVTIDVTPENDSPVFSDQAYAVVTPENAPAGTAVAAVSARTPRAAGCRIRSPPATRAGPSRSTPPRAGSRSPTPRSSTSRRRPGSCSRSGRRRTARAAFLRPRP